MPSAVDLQLISPTPSSSQMQIVTFRLLTYRYIYHLFADISPAMHTAATYRNLWMCVCKKTEGRKRKEQKETGTDMILSSNFQWRRPKCQQAKLLKIPEETLYSFNSTAHLAKNFTWTSEAWSNQKSSTPYPDTHRVRSWPHLNPCWNFIRSSRDVSIQNLTATDLSFSHFFFFTKEDSLKTIVLISSAASQFTVGGWLNWTLVMRDAKRNKSRIEKISFFAQL